MFRQYFGTYYPAIDEWQIPAQWQSALGCAGLIGNYIGIVSSCSLTESIIMTSDIAFQPFGGWLVERLGYRYALMINYALIMPFIAISAFSINLTMLFLGGLLQGVPFGVFSTLVSLSAQPIPSNCQLNWKRDSGLRIRVRGVPRQTSWLPYRMDKHQLGPWPVIWDWHRQRYPSRQIPLGIPSRLHDPMDLADPSILPYVGGTRCTVVARSQRSIGRGRASGQTLDITWHSQLCACDRPKHDPNQSTGERRGRWRSLDRLLPKI